TVLYAARKAERVYCFEPDYVAYKDLLRNIELNGLRNVVPSNVALAGSSGLREMGSFGSGLGDSMTSLLGGGGEGDTITVTTLAWSDWLRISGVERIDFIKMDIEGGEFELLPAMRDYLAEHRPTLYLSLHPQNVAE